MTDIQARQVTFLELQTSDPEGACEFLSELLGWRAERLAIGDRSYTTLALGDGIQGGVARRRAAAVWVPYVDTDDVVAATERARMLGASILVPPREGPVGWRSVLASPVGGEIALWQPKR